jgi:hypothetical protein
MRQFSPLRAQLASFEHAYAIALRLRRETGCDQFVVRTGNPIQPVRITMIRPADSTALLALVL